MSAAGCTVAGMQKWIEGSDVGAVGVGSISKNRPWHHKYKSPKVSVIRILGDSWAERLWKT